MGWLSNNATEVAAIGSVFMDLATLVIIFFNMNQFRLNRRSLNIDINFKVFELRKQIYRDTEDVIEEIRKTNSFSIFIDVKESIAVSNERFVDFKELIENSKYLFAPELFHDLEQLLLFCEHGISLEKQIVELKSQDPDLWTEETTAKIQEFNNRKKDIVDCVAEFKIEQFLKYLNVSNFHIDFITEKSSMNQLVFLHKIKHGGLGILKQVNLLSS